jgi:hypothetical protein
LRLRTMVNGSLESNLRNLSKYSLKLEFEWLGVFWDALGVPQSPSQRGRLFAKC